MQLISVCPGAFPYRGMAPPQERKRTNRFSCLTKIKRMHPIQKFAAMAIETGGKNRRANELFGRRTFPFIVSILSIRRSTLPDRYLPEPTTLPIVGTKAREKRQNQLKRFIASAFFPLTIHSTASAAWSNTSGKLLHLLLCKMAQHPVGQIPAWIWLCSNPEFYPGKGIFPLKYMIFFMPLCPPSLPFMRIRMRPTGSEISSNRMNTFSAGSL